MKSVFAQPGRPRVSLCLIVKNEEKNLQKCLGSVAGLFDEIIIVDTGSTDRTKKIARKFKAQIFDFPWCDNFAAARNEGLRHATGDWIFWLDADDRLEKTERAKLRKLLENLNDDNAAYSIKCLCPGSKKKSPTVVDHIRLFRNDPNIRWHYRVHEQIMPAIRTQGSEVRWTDITIRHSGYLDPAVTRQKAERNLRLLSMENKDHPHDPFTLFNLGFTYHGLGRYAEALPLLRRSLKRSHPGDSIIRKIFALIISCQRKLGQSAEALATCRRGLALHPDDAELLFIQSDLLRRQGDLAGAEHALRNLLASKPAPYFASVDPGLREYKARNRLAILCRKQNKLAEAKAHWRKVVTERPDFLPAWKGLGELYLKPLQPYLACLMMMLTLIGIPAPSFAQDTTSPVDGNGTTATLTYDSDSDGSAADPVSTASTATSTASFTVAPPAGAPSGTPSFTITTTLYTWSTSAIPGWVPAVPGSLVWTPATITTTSWAPATPTGSAQAPSDLGNSGCEFVQSGKNPIVGGCAGNNTFTGPSAGR